jgi:hypothetical protein
MTTEISRNHMLYPSTEDSFFCVPDSSVVILNVLFNHDEYTYSKDSSSIEVPLSDLISHYLSNLPT